MKYLPHEARDTNGQGLKMTDALSLFKVEFSNDFIRKGNIKINNQVIKDILYVLPKGSHLVSVNHETIGRITVI